MNISRRAPILTVIVAVVFLFGLTKLAHAATVVGLGTTSGYAVLGASTVTNTGSSVITGDLGLSPGTSVTGFPPGTVSGTQHITDTAATQAQTDLVTAYNDAAGQTPTTTVPTELGGTTKTAGIYDSTAGTFQITGTLTLDAQGDPNAVFIFKTASTLITAGSSTIVMANGAQPCNVFWQVGSSATLGTNSTFKGTIMALTAVTLTTGANVNGRVMARDAAVTLDTNVITVPTCTSSTTTTTTTTTTGTPSTTPLIKVAKVPTPTSLPVGAGPVTYNYTVTNTGPVSMNDIKVVDDKCSAVSYISGDTNGNGLLETTETWLYHCVARLSQTTTNIVTASGTANGMTATATATATVAVGHPSLPNTGVHSDDITRTLLGGAAAVLLGIIFLVRQKRQTS